MKTLPLDIKHVVTDSRSITDAAIRRGDTAFVALRTAMGDGHRFVRPLYERGLRHFVVNDADAFADLTEATFYTAPDTLSYLIDTAATRLAESKAGQIVVTGSHCKTTVKELLAETLRQKGRVVARSPRTWNSAMGTALSIIDNLSRNPEVIITETGIDAPGQAAARSSMLRPSIGIITRIDDEHDDAFASHAAKVAEKIALVADAPTIIYDDTDAEVGRQLKALASKQENLQLIAAHGIVDLVAKAAGVGAEDVVFHPVSTRIETRQAPGDSTIFIDSYTDDADSLGSTLDLAYRRLAGRRLVLVTDRDDISDAERSIAAEHGGSICTFGPSLRREDFDGCLIVIKGRDDESRKRMATFFDEARHDTMLEVDLDALTHNFNHYRSLLPRDTGIVGMVKASAYGTGALEVAKTLQTNGAAYLAVAVVDEGVALRRAGITMPIIVLNPMTNRFDALARYALEPAIFSLEELQRVSRGVAESNPDAVVRVHVKLDTGMHRLGFLADDIDSLAEALKATNNVCLASVFSHLATADCPDMPDYTAKQVADFEAMTSHLKAKIDKPFRRHLLNTAGISTLGNTDAAYDMARLGLGLYGISPLGAKDGANLLPVASLVSTIISLKNWPAGTPIGYGCKGVTSRDSVIATVPIGYADGIDRRLGNGAASFYVNGTMCPTIGNVCMDLLMLDVTDAPGVCVGSRVEIFGKNAPVERLSDTLGTIPYEILTSVSERVRRTYFHN